MKKTNVKSSIDKSVIKVLAESKVHFPNKLATFYTPNNFVIGVLCYNKDNIDHAHSISLNKELAEYLYNALGKFLDKQS